MLAVDCCIHILITIQTSYTRLLRNNMSKKKSYTSLDEGSRRQGSSIGLRTAGKISLRP